MATHNRFGYIEIYDDIFCDSFYNPSINTPSFEELLNIFHELHNGMSSLCIRNIELKKKLKTLTNEVESIERKENQSVQELENLKYQWYCYIWR